ncbi:2-oxoacid:acceptor oxidoreductase family protein [Terrisporobacter hibernicus]|uniref:2-oxoacid:acceptor oxidoreductase family protein n=1 Tax=Terrisporobacter hibernicus TaxID=2813371 RepID=A0AAX2ZHC4_9FIRM|nr:2-oxoacid:acceptor oxidoreductase family protein [Terrisporobacter hibernicus]UEL48719.1 2-oxoacid:acceptor oxidoreductase family protein [Terrisporobacter hibernicus]
MLNEIICAGFGGQGVLTAGKILIYVAYKEKKQLTWFPSYGNEMRGGSANCNVVISDEKIASPVVKNPTILLGMNSVSVNKYEPLMKKDGYMFVNSSLVDKDKIYRDDVNVILVPVTEIAQGINNERAANICMLGAMIKKLGIFTKLEFEDGMCEYFENLGKGKFNSKNLEAFEAGYNYEFK